MTKDQLRELRNRIVEATKPDRLVDRALADMIELPRDHGGGNEPFYTRSRDAAASLEPPQWTQIEIKSYYHSERGWSWYCNWLHFSEDPADPVFREAHGYGHTEPLARCHAAVEYELAKLERT